MPSSILASLSSNEFQSLMVILLHSASHTVTNRLHRSDSRRLTRRDRCKDQRWLLHHWQTVHRSRAQTSEGPWLGEVGRRRGKTPCIVYSFKKERLTRTAALKASIPMHSCRWEEVQMRARCRSLALALQLWEIIIKQSACIRKGVPQAATPLPSLVQSNFCSRRLR